MVSELLISAGWCGVEQGHFGFSDRQKSKTQKSQNESPVRTSREDRARLHGAGCASTRPIAMERARFTR
eukprot:4401555-Prymnesium_polylepis.1